MGLNLTSPLQLIVAGSFLLFSACALPKPYVGDYVRYDNPLVCECMQLPHQCEIQTEHYRIVITVKRGEAPDQYELEGVAHSKLPAVFSRLSSDSRFSLLIINDSKIIDNVNIFPQPDIANTELTLKRKFSATPFDAIAIIYSVKSYG
ncbi:MAG: hypothetical protein SWH61_17905 [Thermodesulfobacteriota bacterium]|nr:hypothetical protein [Thermodesulfobacteriota bacterium]